MVRVKFGVRVSNEVKIRIEVRVRIMAMVNIRVRVSAFYCHNIRICILSGFI